MVSRGRKYGAKAFRVAPIKTHIYKNSAKDSSCGNFSVDAPF